jgi:hypothetical protein
LEGRDKAGQWDYGVLANIMDGMNVQTQGNCENNTYSEALNDLVSQYLAAGATSDLFAQVTVGSNQRNAASPAKAIDCAEIAWAKPQIDRITLWPDMGNESRVEDYLELREELLTE